MTVEELFRDSKGCRFGAKLFWTQFKDPDALTRFLLMLAIELILWILIGAAAARRDPLLRLVCRKKGPHQSYVTIGVCIAARGGGHPSLSDATVGRLLEPQAFRLVAGAAVGGK